MPTQRSASYVKSSFLFCAALALIVSPLEVMAQEEAAPPATHTYEAYHQISYADLEEWIQLYREHAVPLLQQMQEDGKISGWNVYQHSTGGEYNWRFAIRVPEWVKLDEFWTAYLDLMQTRSPEAFRRSNELIQAHYDEIWSIDEIVVPEPGNEIAYLYESKFQLHFKDLFSWGDAWKEAMEPALNEAMEADLLDGYVIYTHNTGGRFNWKVLYIFDEWDDIDDFNDKIFAVFGNDPALMAKLGNMFLAHDDIIWAGVPNAPDDM